MSQATSIEAPYGAPLILPESSYRSADSSGCVTHVSLLIPAEMRLHRPPATEVPPHGRRRPEDRTEPLHVFEAGQTRLRVTELLIREECDHERCGGGGFGRAAVVEPCNGLKEVVARGSLCRRPRTKLRLWLCACASNLDITAD